MMDPHARGLADTMPNDFTGSEPVIQGPTGGTAIQLPEIISLLTNGLIQIIMNQSVTMFAGIHDFS